MLQPDSLVQAALSLQPASIIWGPYSNRVNLQGTLALSSFSLLLVMSWCVGLSKLQKSHFWVTPPVPGSLLHLPPTAGNQG